jgi:hypothetical protein
VVHAPVIHHPFIDLARFDSLPRRCQEYDKSQCGNDRPRELAAGRSRGHQIRFVRASRSESGSQYRELGDYACDGSDPEDCLSQRLIHLGGMS